MINKSSCISSLINEVCNIENSSIIHHDSVAFLLEELDQLKNTSNEIEGNVFKLLLLFEGFLVFLQQFGVDKEIYNFIDGIVNKIYSLQSSYCRHDFINTYTVELENALLLFAAADKIFSVSLLEHFGFSLLKNPWRSQSVKELIPTKFSPVNKQQEINVIPDGDVEGRFIPSIYLGGGFIVSKLDEYTEEFVKYASRCNGKVLTFGSGYGIPERLAAIFGAKEIICNDICIDHLEIIKNLIPKHLASNFQFILGAFPHEIKIPKNSIDLIGIFRLLHFFEPELLIFALKTAYDILSTNGIIILSAETPYLGNWQKFIPEYESRKLNGDPWPGYIKDTSKYETGGFHKKLPPTMHFLDIEVLTKVLEKCGFSIIKCTTFDRSSTFPKHLLLNGNESVGVIAQKVVKF